jgi:hypothetical protein
MSKTTNRYMREEVDEARRNLDRTTILQLGCLIMNIFDLYQVQDTIS